MNIFNYILIAAESATPGVPSLPEGGNTWATIIYSSITAVIALLSSFWFSRKKQRTDDFAAFMEESADFREEIRKELERKKGEYEKEVEHYKKLLADQITETERLRKDNEDYITHYKFVIDYMHPLVWTADVTGDITFFNLKWYEYTGLSFDQAKDTGWMQAVHPDDIENLKRLWAIAIKRSMPFEVRARFQHISDSVYRWFLIKVTPRYDAHGRVIQWIGVCVDINELMSERLNATK